VEATGEQPAGRRTLIGDAERDRLTALLREHYAAGRLSLDELRRRVEVVLAAGYADEATAVLADLPGGAAAIPAGTPGPGGASGTGSGRRAGWLPRKGHAQTHKPQPGWVPTTERFRDPSSGVIMRVWIDPSDQSRHYVPDTSTG
jgi:Domain of unknown function (DUF1707)